MVVVLVDERRELQMDVVLKVLLASLFILCILTTSINVLPITAKFGVRNSYSTSSYDEISNSQNVHEMMEHAYPYSIFEDRILGTREFGTSSQDVVGLEWSAEKHDCFLEYDVLIGTFKAAKVKFAGSDWDIIICNNTANLNMYGKPAVPYKKMLVPIGGAEILSVTADENMTKEISEVKVLPGLKPLPVGFSYLNWSNPNLYLEKNFYADPLIYFSDREFPSDFVQHEVVRFKGNRFLSLTVFPFKFYPKDSVLKVFDIRVSVKLTEPVMISQPQIKSTFGDDNSGYVIVTASEFSGAVESFATWKERLGFSVQIIKLERIYSDFGGRDNAEKVRNFINASYSANGTEYYLLVGDCDVCPVREVWDPVNVGFGCDNGTEPSDLYYECLDGDWDANGNDVFGEADDDVDLYPEVKVGRIPVNTTEDVERVLAMIRKIEENPEPGEWIKNFLLIAPQAFTTGDSAAALEEEIYKKFLADSFFHTKRLYNVDGSLSSSAVVSTMNQGVGLVDFFDHGAYDTWVGALQTSDVLNLHNGNRTFLAFAMACETAAFDYQEYTTIAEAFFLNPSGGAIAYIGATRIAFAGYDCFDGLHHRFWSYFLRCATERLEANPKHALQDALAEMVSTYHVSGPTMETIYQAIYFGDPSLNLCWKHNVTTTVTPNLETEKNGVLNGTCSLLHSGTPITGEYKAVIRDPIGTLTAEKSGNLGNQGNYTVDFTTTNIPGNYTIETTLTNPFNYTHVFTFAVGTLNITVKLDSDPIYGVLMKVLGQVLDVGNPVAGAANISIINEGVIVNSKIVEVNSSGQYKTEMNLTTFGVQALHVWFSNNTKHGGTSAAFKVKRGDILIIADDSGEYPIYPGGWYDWNKGSSTSYYSFYKALTNEYDVSVYRIIYDEVPSLAVLQQYSAVIATCGDHYGHCLTSPYRNLTHLLTQYHNSGGDLMFEGGDIAYSLAGRDYTEFMQSVLHASFIQDVANMGVYLNNTSHQITQDLPSQIPLTGGLGSPSVDLVLPTNGSEMVSGFLGYSGCSITAFSGNSALGSVVYFSFSVDGINNMKQRSLMIMNSMEYLLYPTLSVKLSDYALLVNTSETIWIHVKDSDTKQPIRNATVTANGCGVSVQNETDSNGRCGIFIAPTSAGIINITTEKTGFPNFTAQVIVYSIPKLTAQITPDAFRKKTQTVSIKVTDFYEYVDVDSVNVALSRCGVSETGYTNSTGNIEFTITPTDYGRIQLNATKHGYENYTCLVDVHVNAVIVDSFGTDEPILSCWDDLNSVWQEHGTIPIHIDTESLNKYGITYQDLVESKADVLIISCSAAVSREYTNEEITAIWRYTLEGHGLIATAGTLYEYTPNNNKLAPIFGIREDTSFTITFIAGSNLNILDSQHPLFINIPSPYPVATGVAACPSDYSWDPDDLLGGTYVAMSDADEGAIIVHNRAVFVSHWVGYMSNNHDFQLMYNAIVWSKYEAPEHDLKVALDVPSYLEPNYTGSVRARIDNMGLNNETGITLMFLVNDTIIHSEVISELTTGCSFETSYLWTPIAESVYNVTVYIPPLLGEENILNNQATRFIEVRYPLIHPVEGQWAKYHTTHYDENGEIVGEAKTQVTYDHYVSSHLVYVIMEIEETRIVDSVNITKRVSFWLVVNIFNRIVEEGSGIGLWYPYWIETNITLGSEVNIEYYTATVVDDQVIRVKMRPIDCWVLVPEWASEYNVTYALWYDKASGLWIGMESEMRFYHIFQIFETNPALAITVLVETNIPIGYQHELEVSLETPASLSLDESALVNMTVYNFGLVKETDVKFEILINGKIVCSGTIPQLENGSSSTMSYLWTPMKRGTYNVTAYVYAVSGENLITNNVENKTVVVTGDGIPPTVSILSPVDGYITNMTDIWLSWEGVDYESGISCYSIYLNGGFVWNVSGGATSWWLPNLLSGSNNVTVVVYDKAGNYASDQITVIVDLTQPIAEIIAPENESYLRSAVFILVNGYDTNFDYMKLYISEIHVATFNDSGTKVYTWDTCLTEDGTYTIKLVVYDKAGNNAEAYVTVVVDNTSPDISWISPSNGSYISGVANLAFTYYDSNLHEVILLLDGRTLAKVTGETFYLWNTTEIADGEHILTLLILDEAGNTKTTLPTMVIIDNTAPEAEILAPNKGQITGGLCDISFRYHDANLKNATIKIAAAVHNVTGATEFALDTTGLLDGNCTITLTVIDKAGNIIDKAVTITVDNTNPAVNIINYSELNGTELTEMAIIELNASDKNLDNVLLYIDAEAFNVTGLYSYKWNTTEVGDGTHTIRLVAYDKAGNMAETSQLSVRTVNAQKASKENYVAGRDFGLTIGAILGLAIGSVFASAVLFAFRKKRKSSKI